MFFLKIFLFLYPEKSGNPEHNRRAFLGQGDQIGRIFAYWSIVYFGQFFEDYRNSPNFCPL
jgi:hypothetical protein